jgi:hypothetical protein
MDNDMTHLTTREAATQSGKSHQQIQRLIRGGKLSAKRNGSGNYQIEKSEFYRVFPDAFSERHDASFYTNMIHYRRINDVTHLEAIIAEKIQQNEFLKEQLELSTKQIEFAHKQLESATLEKNRLLDTISNQQKLIEHQSGKKARKKLFGLF